MTTAREPIPAFPASFVSELLGEKDITWKPMKGGRNSLVHKITTQSGDRYVSKFYLGTAADGRSRLTREFNSFKFLHRMGLALVPQAIVADETRACAVYEYVDGQKLSADRIDENAVDQATSFLTVLHEIQADEETTCLPPAAEACFSVQAVMDNIEARLAQLDEVSAPTPGHKALQDFIKGEFPPALRKIGGWCRQRVSKNGNAMDLDLKPLERTLSPSDFGFHNSIQRDDGQLVFLDFEYFGWDDPAKMISDFILHPAMNLDDGLKQRFFGNMVESLDDTGALARRIEIVYPLFGLKWCLIFLNDFLPEKLSNKMMADSDFDVDRAQAEQLAKARRMLERIDREYGAFPYRV